MKLVAVTLVVNIYIKRHVIFMQTETNDQIGLRQFESVVLFPEFSTFRFVIFYLHEYVFIENDIVFNENAAIVLHLHIIYLSFSYCPPWRPFSKVIVFSPFHVNAR